jgi:multiple sugar transport system permease protein
MNGDSRVVSSTGASSAVGERGRQSLSLQAREAIWFHVFTLPWLLGFLVFTLLPMAASLFLGFTRYNVLQPIFWKSLRVTFLYTAIAVPLGMAVSLFLAMLLNLRVPGMRAIRTIYYLPSILPAVVTGLVWVWLFSADFGLLNYLIYLITGLKGPNWLGSERWVMSAMVISGLWGVGGGVIILLAALQNVPQELYEAAELDGAGVLQRFWHVTVPLISSVILYNLIVGVIGSLQTFARIYVLTGGGPNYASYFYNLYIYDNAFSYLKFGLASAQAWILFVVIMVLTYLALRTSGRWVYYAGGR